MKPTENPVMLQNQKYKTGGLTEPYNTKVRQLLILYSTVKYTEPYDQTCAN